MFVYKVYDGMEKKYQICRVITASKNAINCSGVLSCGPRNGVEAVVTLSIKSSCHYLGQIELGNSNK